MYSLSYSTLISCFEKVKDLDFFVCLLDALAGHPYFFFITLSGLVVNLAVSLAVSLTIGKAEFISGNIALSFSE